MVQHITLLTFVLITMTALLHSTHAQRPPYAGSRPIGYKDRFRPKPTGSGGAAAIATANEIDNRFGELANNLDNSTNVTQRPPVGVEIVYGEPPSDNQDSGSSTTVQNTSGGVVIDVANRLGVGGNNEPQQQQQQPQQQTQSSQSSASSQGNLVNSSTDLFAGGDVQRKPVSSASAISSSLASIVPTIATAAPPFNTARPTTVLPFRPTGLNHVPYDAHGDVFLVNLLNQRPVDQQPFWFVNYQAIEAHRNG